MASKLLLLYCMAAILLAAIVYASPSGVTITAISNTTATPVAGGIINTSGGSISTINLNGTTQNVRWKAFVGNVSGRLSLDSADSYSIFDWSLATISGEIYATRSSTVVNWSGIGCAPLNATETENGLMNHTSPDDNITSTFGGIDNRQMVVGTVIVNANTCRTANLYQNSTDPGGTTDAWEEVILYDRGNGTAIRNASDFGRIVYAQNLENNALGYNNQTTYDFQIIVPERGLAGWTSSTAYYLYLELS